MGLFDMLLGNASEVDPKQLEKLIVPLLVTDEKVEHAYRLIRDLIVFTNKRLILVDKQGLTGKKQEILSIPYVRIVKFSKENAGRIDFDAEIKIWVQGEGVPLEFQFKKGSNIDDIYKVLGAYILK
jgi:Bacterial PH domain